MWEMKYDVYGTHFRFWLTRCEFVLKRFFLIMLLNCFYLEERQKKQKQWIQKGSNLHFLHPPSLSFSHSENKVIIMVLNIVNNISVNVGSLFVISILQYIHYSHFFFSDFYYWMLFMKVSRFILRLRMAVIPAPNTQCNHFFCVIWTLNITRKRQQNSRITLPLTKVHIYYGRVTTLFRTKAMIFCLLLRKVLENVNSTTKYDKMFRIVITIIFNKWISYLLRSLSSSAMVI